MSKSNIVCKICKEEDTTLIFTIDTLSDTQYWWCTTCNGTFSHEDQQNKSYSKRPATAEVQATGC